jgi:phosphoglycolate phosphatase-like HAD superfamily hydrolase
MTKNSHPAPTKWPPSLVIADLDGTIAKIDHRRHWLDKDQHIGLTTDERWRRFFAACPEDEPNEPVIESLRALHSRGYRIVIFSGRSDEVMEETMRWLRKFVVPYSGMHMRDAGDHTPDEELKRSWIQQYDIDRVLCVFDDRQCVVDMWRSLGLTCFQVAPGDF